MAHDHHLRILAGIAIKCVIFAGTFALALRPSDAQRLAPSVAPFPVPSAEIQPGVSPYPKAKRLPTSSDEAQSPQLLSKATPAVGESPKPMGFEEVKAKAETGDADSEYQLGIRYYNGMGVAKDFVQAVKWFGKAAEQNRAEAQYNLGCCYHNGRGVAKDYVEALKWYRKAAEQNLAEAQYYMGNYYDKARGVPRDITEAVKWYRKAAEQGLAAGQYSLGTYYARDEDGPKDLVEAVKWYRKAAEQGLAAAQYSLGVCYAEGLGGPKDLVEAVKWYRKAAEQNNAHAQCNLGFCYAKGEGVAKDRLEAVKWYRKAAEQNNAHAQCDLGFCYLKGEGVAKDKLEALKWYRKAAEQNLAEAQYYMGDYYDRGEGVAKDKLEAVKWYHKAAEQNYAYAQCALGISYAKGEGVAKDEVEGYKWFLLAAAQGTEVAKRNIAVSERRLTREQIAEGQKLARNFKPRKMPSEGDDSSSADIARSRPESSGTGFFITEDGYLVTNEHVAGNGAQVRLITAHGFISARVVKVDAANDLALLKAEGKFAALPVAASRGVRLGATVVTVGFPNVGLQGFAPKFSRGEIGSLSGPEDDARYFQISVPAQPGNSGGALVDERGNVVGVVSAKLSAAAAYATSGQLPENVNYAVKSGFLLSFLESVPDVAAKIKEPNTKDVKFEDVAERTKQAAVLVLVY